MYPIVSNLQFATYITMFPAVGWCFSNLGYPYHHVPNRGVVSLSNLGNPYHHVPNRGVVSITI